VPVPAKRKNAVIAKNNNQAYIVAWTVLFFLKYWPKNNIIINPKI